MSEFPVGRRIVGDGHPCFVIAEVGVNHNGDVGLALELIEAAAMSGADAAKFQTFEPARLATASAPKAAYQEDSSAETQKEMLERLRLPAEAYAKLQERCFSLGIEFLSSPFSEEDADLLKDLEVPAFKIPSGELTNLGLLHHVARLGTPMLVSTGMANEQEIEAAIATIKRAGDPPLLLLHCVSAYPAPLQVANIRGMVRLRDRFGLPVGYSDHVLEHEAGIAAAALGASVIERHLTLDRTTSGPDHASSSTPEEMATYVAAIRRTETALGHGRKEPAEQEREVMNAARRSVVAARNLARGRILAASDLTVRRPGTGLPPAAFAELLGRTVTQDIAEGTLIRWEMIE